ncbi:hypothetical protein HYV43_02430 [Candidatus Micrarchaeota archaeon]|nr:hypothetical protein [Candidatus Micrarchaeota archaeon]
MGPDSFALDVAENPQKPVDPFLHRSFQSSILDVVAAASFIGAVYFLVIEQNLPASVVLFITFAFAFRPAHFR